MPRTVKVTLEKGDLTAQSNNLLNGAKSEKLIEIGSYQIRTVINLASVTATEAKKKAAELEAQKVADSFTGQRFKEIDKLVADLKDLLEKDKKGDGTAAAKASTLVKTVSDEIDDTLVEFGKLIRKAVETQVGKLSSSVKSDSSGAFRGLKLKAKFENAGASGLKVKIEELVKKWLSTNEPIVLREATEGVEIHGLEFDDLKKVGSNYQIRCQKKPDHYIICRVSGDTLKMPAVYQITNSGQKTLVVGTPVTNLG